MAVEGFIDWKGRPINQKQHGGNRAASFVYVLVVALNIAYVSTMLNLVLYLEKEMHMGVGSASSSVTNFIGTSSAFALLGGFLSDSYVTRFTTVLIFGPIEFLGYGLLALQAHVLSLHPPTCDDSKPNSNCKSVHGGKAVFLYTSMYLVAIGEGCVRACLASFGGDQFDEKDPDESHQRSSFFNWFTVGISIGAITGLIIIVWIEDHKGYDDGFAACALVVFLGLLVLLVGLPFYRNQRPNGSPLTRIAQVFVAAFQKRRLALSANEEELHQHVVKEEVTEEELLPHTKGFKFLDKASISYGASGKWSLCTVTQVEETKIVLRMVPVFISSVICYMPISQLLTLSVTQGSTMNTKLGTIHISPATILVIPIVMQAVIIVLYDRLFVPFTRRITGYRTGITHLQRVGIGFMTTPIATCAAALIEKKRKSLAAEHGLMDSGGNVPMSVMWLLLQFFAVGINDAFAFVGLLEFFNSEVSRGMKSIGTAIFYCVSGLASLLSSLVIDIANKATKDGKGGTGWLEGNNLNKSYLDRFYWLLSVFGFLGFFNYMFWAKRYVYRQPVHVTS